MWRYKRKDVLSSTDAVKEVVGKLNTVLPMVKRGCFDDKELFSTTKNSFAWKVERHWLKLF